MTACQLSGVMQHVRSILLQQQVKGMTDGRLLELFLNHGDEAAFEALVRRHGPMVLAVCRRVLHNIHDSEDAFQATFLVLARKAASIRPREMVGNWLYGVAYRTALGAKRAIRKRRAKEQRASEMPRRETANNIGAELRPLLDQELERLPDKYRAVLVLCDLEGKTRKEVAHQLRLPEGTVSSRLARARERLAKRLTRQGLALSSGSLAVVLSGDAASACVPASLVAATIKAASLFATGNAATTSAISAKVIALTEAMMKTLLLGKLKIISAVLLLLGIVATTAGLAGFQVLPAQPQSAKPPHPEKLQDDRSGVGKADRELLQQIDRKIAKEPDYKSKPKYCLLVFGPEAKTRVWLVQDGDTLYVDRNGNGDLTEAGEKVTAEKGDGTDEGEYVFLLGDIRNGPLVHKAFAQVRKLDFLASQDKRVKTMLAKNSKAIGYTLLVEMEMPGWKGTGLGGRVRQTAAFLDVNGVLQFADRPQDAPIIHFGGPWQLTLFTPPELTIGRGRDMVLGVGTPGLGAGTTAFIDYGGVVPERAYPMVEVTYPPKKPGEPPVVERYELKRRC
ncbi:MAG TPA: sigma-70 family RNA polymerase sigma factor [Gemmataceae bacterium]|nr:sigma-70 family RNA polymerase sigma factor [Gemmataceae bacterium]